jgi:hypothetical protein
MSTYIYPIAGVVGWWCYTRRYHLLSCYHNAKNDGMFNGVFSLLFPNTCYKVGGADVISFTFGSKVYHYPIVADADKTLSIGHQLLLVDNKGQTLDITPPPGVKLTISAKDFGDDYRLTHRKNGTDLVIDNNTIICWPIEEDHSSMIEE